MAATTKYVFVTGGVLSGLGKGITAASIGNILKARGFSVNIQKCDPYLNVDAGTLSPREHGECFVTRDGAETDLDLGHYERFLDQELTQACSLMSGRVLRKVIDDERAGKYEGHSVQVVPHVMLAIQDFIEQAGEGFDIHIIEIGGTVGDVESLSFIEAVREFSLRVGRENCLYVHVVYLPYLGASKETKTKPAQNAVRELRGFGIVPDILVARSELVANPSVKHKLSLFCGVDEDAIVLLPNAPTIYQVPVTLEDTGIAKVISRKLGLPQRKADMAEWRAMVAEALAPHKKQVSVAVVAKYLDNQDTYMSVFEALRAASWAHKVDAHIDWVDAEELGTLTSGQVTKRLSAYDGVVVPGGFGSRGVEGKIKAAAYALDHKVPYLGLCLGMQVAVIAAARRAGLKEANSTEFVRTKYPVITTMDGQDGKEHTGGTMRLGNYACTLKPGSLSAKLYGSMQIVERHRHRYECNNAYRNQYEDWGIIPVGVSPDDSLVEMVEAVGHPFFIASQFHPEFKSRPNRAHPMFSGFVAALQKARK
ncbi:MAG TPA: CTP synthase [Candidatus Saccharimonadales bacterium]|nr:CTP synthase [Candidatus Saccharimonadales bacterium]